MTEQQPLTFDDLWFYPYDIESLPDIFTCVIYLPNGQELIFEVSDRKNQSREFVAFLRSLIPYKSTGRLFMVGYNSQGYDWPLLNFLLQFEEFNAIDAYRKSKEIINTPFANRYRHVIWPNKQVIPQLDLMKVNGYDNVARSTSLKMLEIAMEMDCVVEYETDWDSLLGIDRYPSLVGYNRHDVKATAKFLSYQKSAVNLRLALQEQNPGLELLNLSDIDMGERLVIEDLEERQPGITGTKTRGGKRTTERSSIFLGSLVLDFIRFETEGFQRIHNHFLTTTITETKGVFDGLTNDFGGIEWVFGTGGIHAAKPNVSYRATSDRELITIDVSSYYPSTAVEWELAPEHLGQTFVAAYTSLRDRKADFKAKKMKTEETAAKLAANATFGKGGSKFSCLHDPAFMLGITINGQLMLCMLAEQLVKVPTLELIQANTDGITLIVDKTHMPSVDALVKWWEQLTRLNLDYDYWSMFFQRDVNSYIAVDTDGGVKGKGAYEWRTGVDDPRFGTWHKDQSEKVVRIAAEEYLINGTPLEQTIRAETNPFRFMKTLKVQRSDKLILGGEIQQYQDTIAPNPKDVEAGKPTMRSVHVGGVRQQNQGRCYVVNRGGDQLYKIMKPTAKLPHHWRPQAILKDVLVAICNDVHDFDWNSVDYPYYINAARDLVAATGTEI